MSTLHHQTLMPTKALPASAPALVLLHGWGASSAVWQPVLPLLREHFRITLIDLPGFGRSQAVAADTLAEWQALVLAVAPPQAIWMGWSLGGLLALHVAHQAPARVTALALVAANPCFVQRQDWASAMPEARFSQFRSQFDSDPEQAVGRFIALQCLGSVSMRSDVRFLQEQARQHGAGLEPALLAGLELLAGQDARSEFAGVEPPVLALLGGQDQLVPVELKDSLEQLRPDTEVAVIEEGAHLPFLSHPEPFSLLFHGFCRQHGLLT